MERLPSKCSINFNISSKPCYLQDTKAISEIEGSLTITIAHQNIFEEENILLAEFYLALSKWYQCSNLENTLVYKSMDYEDEPILEFSTNSAFALINSAWLKDGISAPVSVDLDSFIQAISGSCTEIWSEIPNIVSLN